MRIPCLLVAIFVLLASNAFAGGPSLPDGWRLPTKEELDASWRRPPNRDAWISGDFNGDGLNDGAFLAIRTDSDEGGLLAFLYRADASETWVVLTTLSKSSLLAMGVSLREPGPVKILGPTGYDEPKLDRELKNDAIDFYIPESGNSLFEWKSGKTFERLWESD